MSKIHKHFYFIIFFVFLISVSLFTAVMAIHGLNPGKTLTNWIYAFTFLTPIIFIISSFWYRYYDSIIARTLYIVSAYVGGVFIYWFFSSVVMSLFFITSSVSGITNFFEISLFLYILATLLSILGYYQSLKIKVTKYYVSTPSQYPSLVGKKFVMIADTHLGPINQEVFARKVFKKILEINPSAVLFPGDMFDSECYADVENIKKEIRTLTSKVPVFFTPGNHEQYGPFIHFLEIASEGGMTVLVDESVRFMGVPIFGLNFRQTKRMDEITKLINESISPEHPAIVLNHEPVFHDLFVKAGAFLVVSGHTHNGQFWPGVHLVKSFFYGKFTYGLRKIEGLTSITTSGVGTFGSPMRTFNTPEIVEIEFQ